MLITILSAALLTSSPLVPVMASQAKNAPAASTSDTKPKKPDFGELIRMMDKFFPAQPEPDPGKLALARVSVVTLLPDGTYGRAMGGMMDTFATSILNMSESDLGKGKAGKPPSEETLRQKLARDDPHFEERMAIIKRIAGEELVRLSAIVEPRIREGLARSMARRFDQQQLTDLNAFLATDSGKAFGKNSMAMWVDPDLIRSMMAAMPDLITAIPGIAARIERETSHLPKPKPKAKTQPNASKRS